MLILVSQTNLKPLKYIHDLFCSFSFFLGGGGGGGGGGGREGGGQSKTYKQLVKTRGPYLAQVITTYIHLYNLLTVERYTHVHIHVHAHSQISYACRCLCLYSFMKIVICDK